MRSRPLARGGSRGLADVARAKRAAVSAGTTLLLGEPRSASPDRRPAPRAEAEGFLGQVQRAPLHLVVDAPQVLADDAEEDQLDAAEEEHGHQRGGLPGHTL